MGAAYWYCAMNAKTLEQILLYIEMSRNICEIFPWFASNYAWVDLKHSITSEFDGEALQEEQASPSMQKTSSSRSVRKIADVNFSMHNNIA